MWERKEQQELVHKSSNKTHLTTCSAALRESSQIKVEQRVQHLTFFNVINITLQRRASLFAAATLFALLYHEDLSEFLDSKQQPLGLKTLTPTQRCQQCSSSRLAWTNESIPKDLLVKVSNFRGEINTLAAWLRSITNFPFHSSYIDAIFVILH